jgi:DNA mismatch repair ATPase MutL
MSAENNISIQIPAETLSKVKANLKECAELLKPYLIALTPADRQDLPKMSDKTLPFVEKVFDYAGTNPEFAPAYLSIPELKTDLTAYKELADLSQLAEPLCDNLRDTQMLSGSEAYTAALAYYNSVKQAAKMNVPNAKTILEDLSKRFEGQGVVKKPKPPAT